MAIKLCSKNITIRCTRTAIPLRSIAAGELSHYTAEKVIIKVVLKLLFFVNYTIILWEIINKRKL